MILTLDMRHNSPVKTVIVALRADRHHPPKSCDYLRDDGDRRIDFFRRGRSGEAEADRAVSARCGNSHRQENRRGVKTPRTARGTRRCANTRFAQA